MLCFALLVRCGILLLTPNALQNDPDDYGRLAANLVEYGTFGAGDVPTAYRPPLYPLALAGCAALGDYTRAAIGVLHVLLGVATVGLVLALGRCWGLGRRGAALAAMLVACDPILLASSSLVMTETLATFLATAGLLALTAGSQRLPEGAATGDRPPGAVGSRLISRQMAAGMALALAALCRPAFLLWTLAAGVVFWRQAFQRYSTDHTSRGPTARGRFANGFRAPAAFALGALVVLSPWAIRNQLQFGRPIVTTTHGGYTMLLANNPEFYDWLRSGSWGSVWQADQFNADWNRRRPGDELRDDRQAYAEAWQTIRAEPGTFLRACAVRIGRFWSPLPHQVAADETPLRRLSRYAVALWYIAEFALAMLGICRICRLSPRACFDFRVKRGSPGVKGDSPIFADTKIGTVPFPLPPSTWLWGFLLVGCLLAGHVVYWTDMRMRAPAMPVVAIVAACGFLYRRECDHDAVKR